MKKILYYLEAIFIILIFPIRLFFALVFALGGYNPDFTKARKSKKYHFKGLTKYEIDEVKKGRYKPSQFAEKEEGDYLDSDDYYIDD